VAASVAAKTGSSRTALAIYIEHDPNWIVALPIFQYSRSIGTILDHNVTFSIL
jgi:hypothetical protein